MSFRFNFRYELWAAFQSPSTQCRSVSVPKITSRRIRKQTTHLPSFIYSNDSRLEGFPVLLVKTVANLRLSAGKTNSSNACVCVCELVVSKKIAHPFIYLMKMPAGRTPAWAEQCKEGNSWGQGFLHMAIVVLSYEAFFHTLTLTQKHKYKLLHALSINTFLSSDVHTCLYVFVYVIRIAAALDCK